MSRWSAVAQAASKRRRRSCATCSISGRPWEPDDSQARETRNLKLETERPMTIIMKFGGTSMGDAQRIRQCADLVRKHSVGHRVVSVVSAMSGVTDALLELAAAAA